MKDKEDLSKNYLSYSKLPVLDMKWENCDINVVDQTNISNFSKIGYVMTPLRLLELSFDDVLVDMLMHC